MGNEQATPAEQEPMSPQMEVDQRAEPMQDDEVSKEVKNEEPGSA